MVERYKLVIYKHGRSPPSIFRVGIEHITFEPLHKQGPFLTLLFELNLSRIVILEKLIINKVIDTKLNVDLNFFLLKLSYTKSCDRRNSNIKSIHLINKTKILQNKLQKKSKILVRSKQSLVTIYLTETKVTSNVNLFTVAK